VGGEGNDTLAIGDGNDSLVAGDGDDSIRSSFSYDEGASDDDTISAGDGDDHIALSGGMDSVSGGSGSDTFEVEHYYEFVGQTRISDFDSTDDYLDIFSYTDGDENQLADLIASGDITDDGFDTTLVLESDSGSIFTIVLEGVLVADLTEDNFVDYVP
jgi:hypothetical protein